MCYRKPGPRCQPHLVLSLRDSARTLADRLQRVSQYPENQRYQQALAHVVRKREEDLKQLASTPLGLVMFGDAKRRDAKRWLALREVRENANKEHAAYQRRRRQELKEHPERKAWRGEKQSFVPTIDPEKRDLLPNMPTQHVRPVTADAGVEHIVNMIRDPRVTRANLIELARTTKNEEVRVLAVTKLAEVDPEAYAVLAAKVEARRESIRNS